MSDPFITELQVLARSELALARIQAQQTAVRLALAAGALVFALLGLGMANVAAFCWLSPGQGPAMAGLVVSLVDLVVAAAVPGPARVKHQPED